MDDPLLVGMADRIADLPKAGKALVDAELVAVAVLGDGFTFDILHHKVGPAVLRGAGIDDLRDVWMVEHGQGLALHLEACDDPLGIHAGLDELQGHLALNGVLLLGQIDHGHAALTQVAHEPVLVDPGTEPLRCPVCMGHLLGWGRLFGRGARLLFLCDREKLSQLLRVQIR